MSASGGWVIHSFCGCLPWKRAGTGLLSDLPGLARIQPAETDAISDGGVVFAPTLAFPVLVQHLVDVADTYADFERDGADGQAGLPQSGESVGTGLAVLRRMLETVGWEMPSAAAMAR